MEKWRTGGKKFCLCKEISRHCASAGAGGGGKDHRGRQPYKASEWPSTPPTPSPFLRRNSRIERKSFALPLVFRGRGGVLVSPRARQKSAAEALPSGDAGNRNGCCRRSLEYPFIAHNKRGRRRKGGMRLHGGSPTKTKVLFFEGSLPIGLMAGWS